MPSGNREERVIAQYEAAFARIDAKNRKKRQRAERDEKLKQAAGNLVEEFRAAQFPEMPGCPVVEATVDDLSNFVALVERLHEEYGDRFGMVKIIIPEESHRRLPVPPTYTFRVRKQTLPQFEATKSEVAVPEKKVKVEDLAACASSQEPSPSYPEAEGSEVKAEAAETADTAEPVEAVPKKRGRGRPRKRPILSRDDEAEKKKETENLEGSEMSSHSARGRRGGRGRGRGRGSGRSSSTYAGTLGRSMVGTTACGEIIDLGTTVGGLCPTFPLDKKAWTVREFRDYCSTVSQDRMHGLDMSELSESAMESLFWHLVDKGILEDEHAPMSVLYGIDLECSDAFRDLSWYTGKIARSPDSLLCQLDRSIPGVTDPMLYIGGTFSRFCWHIEDSFLFSASYLREGTAKRWYSVTGSEAERMEEAVKSLLPSKFQNTLAASVLLQKTLTANPAHIAEKGVPICATTQKPGELVVTFPRAYHAGFSFGYTMAEAVNVAPCSWLAWGIVAEARDRQLHRPVMMSTVRLLVTEVLLRGPYIAEQQFGVTGCPDAAAERKLRQWNVLSELLGLVANKLKHEVQRLQSRRVPVVDSIGDIPVMGQDGADACNLFPRKELQDAMCTVCNQCCYLATVVCAPVADVVVDSDDDSEHDGAEDSTESPSASSAPPTLKSISMRDVIHLCPTCVLNNELTNAENGFDSAVQPVFCFVQFLPEVLLDMKSGAHFKPCPQLTDAENPEQAKA